MGANEECVKLLAPIPRNGGECKRRVLHEAPFEDWVEVRVTLRDASGLRIITAMFDQDDAPGSVSDVITIDGGLRQEAVSARLEVDGRIQGTYSLLGRDKATPRPLTDKEAQALRNVATALRLRYP